MLAVQSTRVLPKEISADPWAWSRKSVWIPMVRRSSGLRPSWRVVIGSPPAPTIAESGIRKKKATESMEIAESGRSAICYTGLMAIRIRYFGAAREKAGTSGDEVACAQSLSLQAVLDQCVAAHPELSVFTEGSITWAIDQVPVRDLGVLVPDGAEVAWLPPVGGGMSEQRVFVRFMEGNLSCDDAFALVNDPRYGGNALFVGTTRSPNRGKDVECLSYEIYHAMAEKTLLDLGEQILEEFGAGKIAFLHKEGECPPGETSVIVAVSSAHREAAFLAGRAGIDRLKEKAAIWKKEISTDGEAWVENKESDL
jgi:molybdopterin synthase catalytic subunit